MRFLFIGDIVGEAGRTAAQAMIVAVDSEEQPLGLPLGRTSVSIIRQHTPQQEPDLDRWEEVFHLDRLRSAQRGA